MSKSKDVQNWRTRTKTKLVEGFGGKCGRCGYSVCNSALSFHHVEDNKSFGLSQALSKIKSWDSIKEEAKKCVMLCNNCHAEHHEGLFDITVSFNRFDETLIDQTYYYNTCECGSIKKSNNKYCSTKCAANKRYCWDNVDVFDLYSKLGSYNAVGRKLGISGNAVRKRILRGRHQGDNRHAVNVD